MTSRFAAVTLGSIVADDYRAGAVLDAFALDFCRDGKRTLEEACGAQGVAVDAVVAALDQLGPRTSTGEMPDAGWAADALSRFIVSHHHSYVRTQLPVIAARLTKLSEVHGARHPELLTITHHFRAIADELTMHLMKEEEILFPFICALARAEAEGSAAPPNMFGTVMNPIRMMEAEHQSAGNELELVRALTGNFTVPADGCATYRVCFEELAAFDRDLRAHIHLENNILFPKAVALEAAVTGVARKATA